MKLLKKLESAKLISPPSWLPDNMLYAIIHGSELYGCATGTSDKDIYGVCLPQKSILFPHIGGWINGFKNPPSFDQWQQHHIEEGDLSYDFHVFGLPRYLRMLINGNPHVTECLFAPQDCILHKTESFQLILDNKVEFLTKKVVPAYRGYLVSQLHKLKIKQPEGKRKETVEKFGYDVKFAYHTVRLALYCEQILTDRFIDLRRDSEIFKAVRRGDWTLNFLENFVGQALLRIEKLILNSTLPDKPDEYKIYELMVNVIESQYGSISNLVQTQKSNSDIILAKMRELLSL